MKHFFILLPLLALSLVACEKNELATLEDLRPQAAIWQLDAHVFGVGGGPETQFLDSERTLQFWEGDIYSNGSFCDLTGPAGAVEEVSYDPLSSQFTVTNCASSSSINFTYVLDLEAGFLSISDHRCVEGCSFRYRRMDQ